MNRKPLLGPLLVAGLTFLEFFIAFLGPSIREALELRATEPDLASIVGIVYFFVFVGAVVVVVGIVRLRRVSVRLSLLVLLGYPSLLLGKALIGGHSSFFILRFLALLIAANGLAVWYLIQPAVRAIWSQPRSAPILSNNAP